MITESINLYGNNLLVYDPVSRSILVNAKRETQSSKHQITLQLKNDRGDQVKQTVTLSIVATGKNDQLDKKLRLLTARFVETTASGLAVIKFSEAIIPQDKNSLDKIDKALKVEAFKFDEVRQAFSTVLPLGSRCARYSDDTLELQLTFDDPLSVSTGPLPDRLVVSFIDERLFMTVSDFVTIEPYFIVAGNIVPQYASPVQAQLVELASAAANNGSYLVVIGLVIGQLAGKSVIERIWSMFMALQIAVLVIDYESI